MESEEVETKNGEEREEEWAEPTEVKDGTEPHAKSLRIGFFGGGDEIYTVYI